MCVQSCVGTCAQTSASSPTRQLSLIKRTFTPALTRVSVPASIRAGAHVCARACVHVQSCVGTDLSMLTDRHLSPLNSDTSALAPYGCRKQLLIAQYVQVCSTGVHMCMFACVCAFVQVHTCVFVRVCSAVMHGLTCTSLHTSKHLCLLSTKQHTQCSMQSSTTHCAQGWMHTGLRTLTDKHPSVFTDTGAFKTRPCRCNEVLTRCACVCPCLGVLVHVCVSCVCVCLCASDVHDYLANCAKQA